MPTTFRGCRPGPMAGLLLLLSASWAPGGCRTPEIQRMMAGPDEPAPGSTPAPGPAFNLPDAAAPGAQDAGPASPAVGGQACAEEEHKAQPTPLDLLLLVDNSVSTDAEVAGTRKTLGSVVRASASVSATPWTGFAGRSCLASSPFPHPAAARSISRRSTSASREAAPHRKSCRTSPRSIAAIRCAAAGITTFARSRPRPAGSWSVLPAVTVSRTTPPPA
jgi:hypothetical protein